MNLSIPDWLDVRMTLLRRNLFLRSLWCIPIVACIAGLAHGQSSLPGRAFLTKHCYDCHANGATEGGLDLAELGEDLSKAENRATWIRIHDRVRDGEMPPRDAEQPTFAERKTFQTAIATPLREAHAKEKGTVLRRLNRREYENTINDIFGTHLKLVELLPADGRSHEFDNVGESLNISMVQLQRYLEAIDLALESSIAKTTEKPKKRSVTASYANTRGAEKFLGKVWLKRPDGAVVFFRQSGYPSGMLREADVRESGRYKIRVAGYAYQSETPITFSVGATTFQRGVEKPTFGYYSMPPGKPTTIELEAWIENRYMVEVTPQGIDDRYQIKNLGIENYRGPGLAILSIQVEGPLVDQFPSRGHQLVFEGLKRSEIEPRNPKDKTRSWYRPRFSLTSENWDGDVSAALTRVARTAFRRPVSKDEIQPYVELFQTERSQQAPPEEALRTAVAAIFCSPDFLFLSEPDGQLDDYALASRLSYFLTRTLPDQELLMSASRGELTRDSEALKNHTDRLMGDPRFERFIVDFTDAWLNLRDIEFTSPDRNLFPEYDPYLQHSLLNETRSFWRTLIADNRPVTNLVKSDFAMLNERTAEHYQIPKVVGPQVRAVALPADSVRGGFLSQGSILKVSANGTNTSPVVRGVWVAERILGEVPPPPPPGIPGVEPDIRGAKTLRELLDKHRNADNCRACHQKIDPPGFALESFNPIGGWRDRFRSLGEGEKVDRDINGRKVRYRLGPDVDASGEFPEGGTFAGYREFRDRLASNPDRLAKTLVTKLLVFATGREMGFSDREEIDWIVVESAKKGHKIRDLIDLVVRSEIFRRK